MEVLALFLGLATTYLAFRLVGWGLERIRRGRAMLVAARGPEALRDTSPGLREPWTTPTDYLGPVTGIREPRRNRIW